MISSKHDSIKKDENKTLQFGEATLVYQRLILESAIVSNSKSDKIKFDTNTKETGTQISHKNKFASAKTQKREILKIDMDLHKIDKTR